MGIIKMNYLIVLTFNVVSVLCSLGDVHLCCLTNQYILYRNGIYYCYEAELNGITSINLECAHEYVVPKSVFNYEVNENGQLIMHFPDNETKETGKYCLGTEMNLINSHQRPVAIECTSFVKEAPKQIGEIIENYCFIISCLCLSITATIYIALPELRDLQGMSIISLCVSLAFTFSILAMRIIEVYINMTICVIRGFLLYFFMLAAFFWMNVISIQIMLKIRRPSVSSFRWKEFQWYAAYAWGAPVVLTGVVAVVNFMPGDHAKPGFEETCWFNSKKEQWKYMNSVMSILIFSNIGILLYTWVLLWRHTSNATPFKILRYRFAMIIRLSIVMGLLWIKEMLSLVFSSHIIWDILDIIISLQGVFIFVEVVVLRRRTVQCLLRRGWLRCVEGPVERYLARAGDDEEEEGENNTLGILLENIEE